MARKKGSKAEEQSRKELSDGRFTNPLDPRIQEKDIEKTFKKLRKS